MCIDSGQHGTHLYQIGSLNGSGPSAGLVGHRWNRALLTPTPSLSSSTKTTWCWGPVMWRYGQGHTLWEGRCWYSMLSGGISPGYIKVIINMVRTIYLYSISISIYIMDHIYFPKGNLQHISSHWWHLDRQEWFICLLGPEVKTYHEQDQHHDITKIQYIMVHCD